MWNQKNNKELSTGSLLRDVPTLSSFGDENYFVNFSYSITITQACDFYNYYRAIKEREKGLEESKYHDSQTITQVLFLPAFEEEEFKSGKHLEKQYGITFKPLDRGLLEKIKKTDHIRYHSLLNNDQNVPSLFIDFKHYFTVPIEAIRKKYENLQGLQYQLEFPQITDLSDRFAHYLQRVAV
jgi:hypothetical protein